MKYKVFLSDHPYDPMICVANNATDARRAGRRYAKQWKLPVSVVRVEEIVDIDDIPDDEWIPEF